MDCRAVKSPKPPPRSCTCSAICRPISSGECASAIAVEGAARHAGNAMASAARRQPNRGRNGQWIMTQTDWTQDGNRTAASKWYRRSCGRPQVADAIICDVPSGCGLAGGLRTAATTLPVDAGRSSVHPFASAGQFVPGSAGSDSYGAQTGSSVAPSARRARGAPARIRSIA